MPLPPEPEVFEVTSTRVACDGGDGAAGHPRVWLQIDPDKGWVECGYCDRADEDTSTAFLAMLPLHVMAFGANIVARPTRERHKIDAVFLVRLLHASRF
jgi:uncharacterized Zn-finger protein